MYNEDSSTTHGALLENKIHTPWRGRAYDAYDGRREKKYLVKWHTLAYDGRHENNIQELKGHTMGDGKKF